LTKSLFPQGATAFDLNLKGADAIRVKLMEDDPERLATRPSADPKIEYGRTAEALVSARSQRGLFRSVDEAAGSAGLSPAVSSWVKEKTVTGPFILLSADNVGP